MKRLITILTSLIFAFTFYINAEAITEDIPLSPILQIHCWEVGNEFNIDPCLLMSIVYQESRGLVKNKTQITNTQWFKEGIEYCEADEVKSNDYQNIRVCGYYISKWFEELGDADIYLIVECWNEGVGNAIRTHNTSKPSLYAKQVVDRATEWEEIFYTKEIIR